MIDGISSLMLGVTVISAAALLWAVVELVML
jgi:hypothetical protein